MPNFPTSSNQFYSKRANCRIDQSSLIDIFDLGLFSFTGTFPLPDEEIPAGPLALSIGAKSGLVQLSHDYSPELFYTENYGYRSGLNNSMVAHLEGKAHSLLSQFSNSSSISILDIGSNDGTLLNSYSKYLTPSHLSVKRVGVDPTIVAFEEFYQDEIETYPSFFDKQIADHFGEHSFDLITSISMFYDLPAPCDFVANISRVLKLTGLWHFEQSYLLSMLRSNSFDTVCHEHTEYYSVTVIANLLRSCGLKIVDLTFNNINGGSVAVTAAHQVHSLPEYSLLDWIIKDENSLGLHDPSSLIYSNFILNTNNTVKSINKMFEVIKSQGMSIYGLGASTKGNTLLQMPNFDSGCIDGIFEVNSSKYGHVTPGSKIPIIPEVDIPTIKPDYLFVLPWHFKNNLISKFRDIYSDHVKFIFPLPYPEVLNL